MIEDEEEDEKEKRQNALLFEIGMIFKDKQKMGGDET